MQKAIILCGFMGCGKTAVGHALARQLGRHFLDMDSWIAQREGKSVSVIFARDGEAYFRAREREACRILSGKSGYVIATGGGALTFPENAECFRLAECPVVLIDTPLPVILERLSGDRSRPLLQRPDKEAAAKQLFEQRMPLYRAAASVIVDGNASPYTVAARIADALSHCKA